MTAPRSARIGPAGRTAVAAGLLESPLMGTTDPDVAEELPEAYETAVGARQWHTPAACGDAG
jgi:hypothetical protein